MVQIARYPSAKEASSDLSIPLGSIYDSLCSRIPCYDSYFIYENEFIKWRPAEQSYKRVRGIKVSQKLEELRKQSNY